MCDPFLNHENILTLESITVGEESPEGGRKIPQNGVSIAFFDRMRADSVKRGNRAEGKSHCLR